MIGLLNRLIDWAQEDFNGVVVLGIVIIGTMVLLFGLGALIYELAELFVGGA